MDTLVMLVPVALGAVLATVVGAALLRRDGRAAAAPGAAARHGALTTGVALGAVVVVLASVGVAALMSDLPLGGLLLAVLPAAVGLVHLVLRLAGELTWPGLGASVRADESPVAADLPSSWPRGHSPVVLVVWLAVLLIALVAFAVVADGPRTIAATFMPAEPDLPDGAYSVGPFPGWGYGLPIGVLSTAMVLAARWLHGLIARRPPVPGTTTAQDAALRARAALWSTQVTHVLLAVTTAGILAIAGRTLVATAVDPGTTLTGLLLQYVAVGCVLFGVLAATLVMLRGARTSRSLASQT